MFGWLASFGVQSRARSRPCTRWLAIDPRTLFQGLGQLGAVLYVAPACVHAPTDADAAAPGCLVDHPDLAPLLSTAFVGITCCVTPEGPREWLDALDARGALLARIYLLPDTDYLAWDGLFAGAAEAPALPPVATSRRWHAASRPRLLTFTRRRLPGFDVLGACEAGVSSLGLCVARDIAVSESMSMRG